VGDRNVLESNVEFLGAFQKIGTNTIADGLTLGDEFCGVELGDNGLKDFVTDGWEDTLVIILTKVLMEGLAFKSIHVIRRLETHQCNAIPGKSLATS
jgi:hypothetical protein